MKTYILLVALLVIIFCHWSSASNTEIAQNHPKGQSVINLVTRRLGHFWSWVQNQGKSEDNFIGRCFGAAKKLKFVMPLIIFKLGVIITTLAFLTVFSLKSLGLLILLLIINTTGIASKFAFLKHHQEEKASKPWMPPQNVHFHIHQSKDGHFKLHHSGPSNSDYYDHQTWSDRSSLFDKNSDNDDNERLYDSYKR